MELRLFSEPHLFSSTIHSADSFFTLRLADERDIPLIHTLALEIWPAAYATILSEDQINYMLHLMYSHESLMNQMKQQHEFLIVLHNNRPAGFASVSPVAAGVYKLQKLYIHPKYQGAGAGRFVIETILKAIKQKRGTALQLNVNRNNPAVFFYKKSGFIIVKEEDIDIGNGFFMNDYVMEKKV
ncbi:MAG: GNAT family N-acetyltransferase [Chitinophagaceae bacterium]|nr:GNAT family N-acetyltransferase [Chitinophagaceae bacterium]